SVVPSRSRPGWRDHTRYDAAGNLQNQITDPLGNIWTVTADPDGQVLKNMDPLGNESSYTYEGFRLAAEKHPLGFIRTYTHDARGNQTSAMDPLGNVRTWTYDAFNNLLTEQNELGFVSSFSYGDQPEQRRVLTVMNALGYITSYGYTAAGL